jgi:hypothetical protein
MCDKEVKELAPTDGCLHGWCWTCETLFIEVMQLVNCANKSKECDNIYGCRNAQRCMSVRAVTITSSQVYGTRARLVIARDKGMVGVIAGCTKIPEFALRDWIDNPSHFLTQQEMAVVIEALDRYIPEQSAVEGAATL